ncbi:repressor of RNA polymerase III transcription MAF1 [Basidiobolus meristosporus CBS 931.73]|uniref:Repressor of RNA polymerase III transcription MAF1 n=1 Tax=Basidiobolus meristosporus CBS 931.73 TaxID=1314790 RepID=A0A1Y1YVN8_9FUNG|nr:repressor of RNA polymerase III transcription MAF1 [Basidiobolus meristosporus CBS 931.73]|eukprot:ORY02108.1 repressor of RNA polymerase III transcription MAF1 [Basidiobolus meristosporus CBS 931.73]
MKFLEFPSLDVINKYLIFETADSKIYGRVEAFSCKSAGGDKKLFKQLESRHQEELTAYSLSPEQNFHLIISPFGPLDQLSSRKTLFYLISTLNASFPDYEFSDLKPEQFSKQQSLSMVMNSINTTLFSLGRADLIQSHRLWDVLDEVISLNDCDVYSYIPDDDSDPYADEGSIWSFNYFFFNRKLKRILFFTCSNLSYQGPIREDDDMSESDSDLDSQKGYAYEEYIMQDMDE